MAATMDEHLKFWREMADACRRDTPWPFEVLMERMPRSPFAPILKEIAEKYEDGREPYGVMMEHGDCFNAYMAEFVRGGLVGRDLSEVAQRVAGWIADGSLPLPGQQPPGDEHAFFWRILGRMLTNGVPLPSALRALEREMRREDLRQAASAMLEGLLRGHMLAETMAGFPDLFPSEVMWAVDEAEQKGLLGDVALQIADALETGDLSGLPGFRPADLEEMTTVAPARKLANLAMLWGIQKRASDVHFDPSSGPYTHVRLRIDGVLHEMMLGDDIEDPRPVRHDEVINRIKVMAGLDTALKTLPQDGRIQINVGGPRVGRNYDLRVSIVPALHGERACIRILSREAASFDLSRIGLLEDDLKKVHQLMRAPHGIVLVTGPTGSGKTTLFYSMLQEVDRDHCAVMSVEDPIEYDMEGVAQIAVQPQVGLTFARALRSILRQDPDVILCGEIRDTETANVAAQCALTGHLVLTALHADTAPGALKRLVDIGVAPFVVNASVVGVIAQRLVRILCPECKEPIEVPAESLPPEAADFLAAHKDATFNAPKGCDACLHTGYKGRTAIHEILLPDDGVRTAVSDDADESAIRRAALAAGMRPLLIAGLEKAARGITSVQEVLRAVPSGIS